MPHVIVKLWPGKSEQQKKKLAAEITKAVMTTLHYSEEFGVGCYGGGEGGGLDRESVQARHPRQARYPL